MRLWLWKGSGRTEEGTLGYEKEEAGEGEQRLGMRKDWRIRGRAEGGMGR